MQNRPVRENTIRKYVESMKAGQWELNGETIKFLTQGVLLDGQHRLRAVVQSGVTIQSYVVHNLPSKVFDTIDTGANRSIGDLLALQGEMDTVRLGPALRLQYVHDELGSVRELNSQLARAVNNRDLLETLQRHPAIIHSLSFVSGVAGLKDYLTVPMATFLHYQFAQIQQHHADSFLIKLARSTDLGDDHPILALRTRLKNLSLLGNSDRIEALAITIKAWNAFRHHKPILSLRWSKAEDFPEAA